MLAAITEVLAYQNAEVVRRFVADHAVSESAAEQIFLETKRWLWLCAEHSANMPDTCLNMNAEMSVIDEMWHTFLLFTREYAAFCQRYFGRFIHHSPTTTSEKQTTTREKRLEETRATYEYIYDQLGPDVLKLWVEELPKRFGATLP